MKNLRICEIEKRNPDYLDLVREKGTVFNFPEWLDLFGEQLRLYGIFNNEILIGSFYLFQTRIFGISYIKNPVTTPHNGLIYKNDNINNYKWHSLEKSIHQCIAEFFQSLRTGILQFSLPPGVKDVQPYLWKRFKVSPSYTYRIDLNADWEEISSHFDAKLKSDINKAKKDILRVEKTTEMSLVLGLVKKSFERQNKGMSYEYFDKILNQFATPENSFAFITWQDDQPSATSMCVYDNDTAYYILGGYNKENHHRGAGSSCIMAAIEYAKELGMKTFDFEGSMIPAIESYFRGFGGELTVKYSVHRAWLPIEMMLKFFKREVY